MTGTALRLGTYAVLLAGMLAFGICVDASHAQELRQEYVRVTYYTLRGHMADGALVHLGAAACSKWLPFGTQLRLPDGYVVTCQDRGLGDRYWAGWVDVWMPSIAAGRENVTRAYGDYTWVDVLRIGWDE